MRKAQRCAGCGGQAAEQQGQPKQPIGVAQNRILRGTINRKYSLATLRPEHRQQSSAYPYGFAVGGWPKTWTGKVVSKRDWANLSDWERHGSTEKVFCGLTKKWIKQETV